MEKMRKFKKNPYLRVLKQSHLKIRQIMSTENQAKLAPVAKKQIKTQDLRELMLGGMNRKEIAIHLGMPVSTVNKFFKHPDLADLRPKHKSEFELVDGEGEVHSPGALAQAAKEAKEAAALEADEDVADENIEESADVAGEAIEGQEINTQTPAEVTEATGI